MPERKWTILLLKSFVFLFLFLALAETATRCLGYSEFKVINRLNSVSPANFIQADTVLPYRLSPGNYTFKFENGFSFSATHNTRGERISGTAAAPDSGEKIVIYGDSFFYGFGLNDTATFAYKLQQAKMNCRVFNRGILGYSALCSFLRLKDDIQHGNKPNAAVVLMAKYDFNREVYSKMFDKYIGANKDRVNDYYYPYTRSFENPLAIKYQRMSSHSFWLSHYSALYNLVEDYYLRKDLEFYQPEKVCTLIYNNIADLCTGNGIKLLILVVSDDNFTRKLCEGLERKGATVLFCGYDLADTKYSLLPNDNHPNGYTNSLYAIRTQSALDKLGL